MGKVIDLRSDTVTVPTPEMRQAMYRADVGDDVYGEDPTVRRLEELAADKLGKEGGLFVASGTMGNLISVLTHTSPGMEVILEAESHIYYYEVGGCAALGGVLVRTLPGKRGVIDPQALEEAIRPENIHFPATGLIGVENTHNRGGGAVVPLENLKEIQAVARRHGIPVHLDGARIFNAAIAMGVGAEEIAECADTVMFCLSKGLAAPVGSLVVGDQEWIEKARKYRKMVGGGLRQAGVLAAAGIVALEEMVARLGEDHDNARRLAEGLAVIPHLGVSPAEVDTNMVRLDIAETGMNAAQFAREMETGGVLANPVGLTTLRLVTHKDVSRQDIDQALKILSQLAG